jgi:hypothetical protein
MKTRGRFGCKDVREWPAIILMNEKGGMNDDEFDKHINNSIVPLFPNLKEVPSKGLLLKMDSSPGRNRTALLLKARFQGVYLYSGLPNAMSVQQETDINYGPFKSIFRTNLKSIASACFKEPINVSLKASTLAQFVMVACVRIRELCWRMLCRRRSTPLQICICGARLAPYPTQRSVY